MAVEVAGPLRGQFFLNVPADTTVGVTGDENIFVDHPLGKESTTFRASGKNSYVFIKAKGE